MQILLNIVLLFVGFVLLIKGADVFVDGAVGVSRKLKIPAVIIGLTVVAFGTSAPEAAVSIAAAVTGNNGIAAGNIIGSNIFNLMIVAGSAAIFSKLPVSKTIIKKDYPFMTVITVVMLALFLTFNGTKGDPGLLSRAELMRRTIWVICFMTREDGRRQQLFGRNVRKKSSYPQYTAIFPLCITISSMKLKRRLGLWRLPLKWTLLMHGCSLSLISCKEG